MEAKKGVWEWMSFDDMDVEAHCIRSSRNFLDVSLGLMDHLLRVGFINGDSDFGDLGNGLELATHNLNNVPSHEPLGDP